MPGPAAPRNRYAQGSRADPARWQERRRPLEQAGATTPNGAAEGSGPRRRRRNRRPLTALPVRAMSSLISGADRRVLA